jgi:hypothetical protein
MPKPNQNKNAQRKAASAMFALQHLLHDEIRLKEVAEKSAVDFDRVAEALREMRGKKDISVQLLKDSWDLFGVLLAEACELRDRTMILYIIEEIIKRKEPKQQHVKTEGMVDHRVLHLVKTIEDQDLEHLIARRVAITAGEGEARPVRAIPDRRSSREKRSGQAVPTED